MKLSHFLLCVTVMSAMWVSVDAEIEGSGYKLTQVTELCYVDDAGSWNIVVKPKGYVLPYDSEVLGLVAVDHASFSSLDQCASILSGYRLKRLSLIIDLFGETKEAPLIRINRAVSVLGSLRHLEHLRIEITGTEILWRDIEGLKQCADLKSLSIEGYFVDYGLNTSFLSELHQLVSLEVGFVAGRNLEGWEVYKLRNLENLIIHTLGCEAITQPIDLSSSKLKNFWIFGSSSSVVCALPKGSDSIEVVRVWCEEFSKHDYVQLLETVSLYKKLKMLDVDSDYDIVEGKVADVTDKEISFPSSLSILKVLRLDELTARAIRSSGVTSLSVLSVRETVEWCKICEVLSGTSVDMLDVRLSNAEIANKRNKRADVSVQKLHIRMEANTIDESVCAWLAKLEPASLCISGCISPSSVSSLLCVGTVKSLYLNDSNVIDNATAASHLASVLAAALTLMQLDRLCYMAVDVRKLEMKTDIWADPLVSKALAKSKIESLATNVPVSESVTKVSSLKHIYLSGSGAISAFEIAGFVPESCKIIIEYSVIDGVISVFEDIVDAGKKKRIVESAVGVYSSYCRCEESKDGAQWFLLFVIGRGSGIIVQGYVDEVGKVYLQYFPSEGEVEKMMKITTGDIEFSATGCRVPLDLIRFEKGKPPLLLTTEPLRKGCELEKALNLAEWRDAP